jgi:hypothetical protein
MKQFTLVAFSSPGASNGFEMGVHRIFLFITYLLGVNFYYGQKIKIKFILSLIVMNVVNVYTVLYYPISEKWFIGRGIYNILGIYQTVVPFFVQNFIIIRSYIKRQIQHQILKELKNDFLLETEKYQKKFLMRLLAIVIVRLLKYSMSHHISYLVFNTQTAFPELIYSCNDLMFVYYLELMIEYFENISRRIFPLKSEDDLKYLRHKICKIFLLKRKIMHRYSIDLIVTITFNFILTIITFYWLLMRLIYNHMFEVSGFASFLHFLEPCFIFWVVCSRCELFYKTVRLN